MCEFTKSDAASIAEFARAFRPKPIHDRPFAHALSEDEIQRAVFNHLKTRGAPRIVYFHPKNGGIHQRGQRAGINVGLGVRPGVSDVIIFAPSGFYALELKAEGGKPTIEQLRFIDEVRFAGGTADWRAGLDPALEWLEHHKLLRGYR